MCNYYFYLRNIVSITDVSNNLRSLFLSNLRYHVVKSIDGDFEEGSRIFKILQLLEKKRVLFFRTVYTHAHTYVHGDES